MVHETLNRALISNPFVRAFAPKLGWFYFISIYHFFFDMQILKFQKKEERGPMMMSFGGWQNAWLITLVSVLCTGLNMLRDMKDFKLSLTPLLLCARVMNLVYWKASVREMMCVNCMNATAFSTSFLANSQLRKYNSLLVFCCRVDSDYANRLSWRDKTALISERLCPGLKLLSPPRT